MVDGKRLLFEDNDALFQRLKKGIPSVSLIREHVALSMIPDEIHDDVHRFFGKLNNMVGRK